jgi:hypothetical protein
MIDCLFGAGIGLYCGLPIALTKLFAWTWCIHYFAIQFMIWLQTMNLDNGQCNELPYKPVYNDHQMSQKNSFPPIMAIFVKPP